MVSSPLEFIATKGLIEMTEPRVLYREICNDNIFGEQAAFFAETPSHIRRDDAYPVRAPV